MAKVTLEFEPNEDREALHHAIHAGDAFAALHEIAEKLRAKIKYSNDLKKETREMLDELQTFFYDAVNDFWLD